MKKSQNPDLKRMTLCALFSVLIAVGAWIRIPIPIVPFTLQFLFTNLAGFLLGSRLGILAVGTYVLFGLCGLPVFSAGGGIGYIFHPTFGYIIGFVLGAYLAGFIVEHSKTTGMKTFLVAGFSNLFLVYTLGMIYYYLIANYYLGTPIGAKALTLYCFVLAVPGDIFLCIFSAILARRLRPLISCRRFY